MTIWKKLFLSYIFIALFIGLAGYFSIKILENSLKSAIGKNVTLLADETLDKMIREITHRVEIIQDYSDNIDVLQAVNASNITFGKLTNIPAYIRKINSKWIMSPSITESYIYEKISKNHLSKELIKLQNFYKHKYGYQIFPEIFVTNKYGANIALTGPTSDFYQADELLWMKAKKNKLYISDVAFDESAKVYSLSICQRIDDEKGNFTGVIKGILNIKSIINIINEIKLSSKYKTINIQWLSRNGKLIYNTEKHETFIDKSKLLNEIQKTEIANQSIITELEHNKMLIHSHSKGTETVRNFNWTLIVTYNIKEVYAPVVKLRKYMTIIMICITFAGIIIGFIISVSISKKIRKLANAAVLIGKGDTNVQITGSLDDELGILTEKLNIMSDNITKTQNEFISKIDFYDNIINSIAQSIIVITPEFIIRTVNSTTLKLLEYKEDELLGKSIDTVLYGDDEQFEYKGLLNFLNKETINKNISYKTKTGEKISVKLTCSAMKNKTEDEIIGIIFLAEKKKQ